MTRIKTYQLKISKTSYSIIGLTLLIGLIWFLKGPSDQELLANMAKAVDFNPWLGWWSNNFMAGGSIAPELTTLFTLLPLKFFGFFLGPLVGGKVAGLVALCCAGLAMNLFLCDWTKDQRAGLFGSLAYMMGPQLCLRLGFNEHLPVVFSMVYAPLVLWSLWILVVKRSWKASLLLALSYGAILLTFFKIAICLAPIALGFLLLLGYEFREEIFTFKKPALILTVVLRLLLAGILLIPLVVIPLLPVFREYHWLALFTYEPFQDWQNNFSFQSSLAFLDRNCLLSSGMPPNFTLDHGGFYLGIGTVFLVWYLFFSSVSTRLKVGSDKEVEQGLKKIATASLALLFLSAWLSLGPHSLVSRTLLFLQSAEGVHNEVIPLFWGSLTAAIFLVWRLLPDSSNKKRDKICRTTLLFFFLFVPGFKVLELFPFAQGIRAPWSLWQLGGSVFLAALFGSSASFFIESLRAKKLQKIFSVALLILVMLDFSPYLLLYHQGALREGTYDDFLKTVEFLKKTPTHSSIMPFSGRYFYLQLPSLTGHPIIEEAFNHYFELKWVRALESSLNLTGFKELLNLLGASYVFIDKEDPSTLKQSQDLYRSCYPVAFENNSFLILENRDSLYPAFLARDFVVFPKDSYSLASASLQLASMNLITLEMTQANSRDLGFAGVAQGNNQVELLPAYKEHGGTPFQRFNDLDPATDHDQQMTYHLPPALSGWLVVTKAFHPDWQGTVDGQPTKIYRAAGALLSLYIPLNSQEIIFKFCPPFWYTLSFCFGMLSWLLALAFFFLLRSRWAPARWKEWWGEE